MKLRAIGLATLILLVCNCSELKIRHRDPNCTLNLRRIGVALEAFHKDNGKYPGSVLDLVPNYLQALPQCKASSHDTYANTYLVGSNNGVCQVHCSAAQAAVSRNSGYCFYVYVSSKKDLVGCTKGASSNFVANQTPMARLTRGRP